VCVFTWQFGKPGKFYLRAANSSHRMNADKLKVELVFPKSDFKEVLTLPDSTLYSQKKKGITSMQMGHVKCCSKVSSFSIHTDPTTLVLFFCFFSSSNRSRREALGIFLSNEIMELCTVRHLWGVDESWETFLPKAKKLGLQLVVGNSRLWCN
jgi:hypothetical protein